MKFLLTNDDGVHAPGLQALSAAARSLGQIQVVAPHEHVSGCSHQTTTGRPLQLARMADDWQMLDGSPADCVRVGLTHLKLDADWVLAGVNEGGNLGADLYLSGTVAAVREACLLGKPAIAISQYHRGPFDWSITADWTRQVLAQLLQRPLASGAFWNVNLPNPGAATQTNASQQLALPPIVFCEVDPHPLPVRYVEEAGQLHYRGVYHDRDQLAGADVAVCFGGAIAVSEVRLLGR